jgi:hypothetical protein
MAKGKAIFRSHLIGGKFFFNSVRRMNRGYCPKDHLFEYTYNEVVEKDLEEAPRLKELVPADENPGEYNKRITTSFVEIFKLKQYQEQEL